MNVFDIKELVELVGLYVELEDLHNFMFINKFSLEHVRYRIDSKDVVLRILRIGDLNLFRLCKKWVNVVKQKRLFQLIATFDRFDILRFIEEVKHEYSRSCAFAYVLSRKKADMLQYLCSTGHIPIREVKSLYNNAGTEIHIEYDDDVGWNCSSILSNDKEKNAAILNVIKNYITNCNTNYAKLIIVNRTE